MLQPAVDKRQNFSRMPLAYLDRMGIYKQIRGRGDIMERFKVRDWVVYVLLSLSLLMIVVKGDKLSNISASSQASVEHQAVQQPTEKEKQHWQEDLLQVYDQLLSSTEQINQADFARYESTVVIRGETAFSEEAFTAWAKKVEALYINQMSSAKPCSFNTNVGYLALKCFIDQDEMMLEWIISPQKGNSTANVIYTWFGDTKETTQMRGLFADIATLLQQDAYLLQPEYFITLASTIEQEATDYNPLPFLQQWGELLQADNIHELKDNQQSYLSTLWHQPNWEQKLTYQSSTNGPSEFNLQLAWRMNTSENKAYIILGYPIILQAH